MAFSQDVKDAAKKLAGNRCECTRKNCKHRTGRCNTDLNKDWHAHHITAVASGGKDILSNCQALCIPCHKNTQTYGG